MQKNGERLFLHVVQGQMSNAKYVNAAIPKPIIVA